MRISRFVSAALLFLGGTALAGQNSTLNVNVLTPAGAPVVGAQVYAVFYNGQHPDPVATQIATVDSTGKANFSGQSGSGGNGLYDTDNYNILVASFGFGPTTLQQQFNAPSFVANQSASTQTISVTLDSTTFNALLCGAVVATVSGATANNAIFCAVESQAGNTWLATSFGRADNSGNASIFIPNVPAGNNYNVVCYNPTTNSCVGAPSGTVACGGGPAVVSIPNLKGGLPPVANVGQSQGGSLSIDGVVTDTNTTPTAIPNVNIQLQGQYTDQFGNQQNDFRGINTDQFGRFQLYGLLPNATYYLSVFAGCNFNTGICYQPFRDNPPTPTPYDILVSSAGVAIASGTQSGELTIKLNQLSGGTGTLTVNVKAKDANGVLATLPWTNVGIWPDGQSWQVGGGACGGSTVNNPGLAASNVNAPNGQATFTGLVSGNYGVSSCNQFGCFQFNGPLSAVNNNGNFNQNYSQCSSGNFRLAIDTTTPGQDVYVFFSSGGIYQQGSTITIVMPTKFDNGGKIYGTISFPPQISPVDLSQHPITITLNPNCTGGNCTGHGGFLVLNSPSTGPVIAYSIPVSSANAYFLNINTDYWGAVYAGGQQPQPDLSNSTYAVVNLSFAPAGRIKGNLYKPDGSLFTVSQNQQGGNPNINAEGDQSWGYTQINNDGSFIIGGLLPGGYHLQAQQFGSGSSFPYTTASPQPLVTVTANQDIQSDVHLVSAVTVQPTITSTGTLPPMRIVDMNQCNALRGAGGGDCPPEDYVVLALHQGTPFSNLTAIPLLTGEGGDRSNQFFFSISTGNINDKCNGSFMPQPGFCPSSLAADSSPDPKKPGQSVGTNYDFYLVRGGRFDSSNIQNGARPYFVIENSKLNVNVNSAKATTNVFQPDCCGGPGSTATIEGVDVTPGSSLGGTPQAVIAGTVSATNIITQAEFQKLGGDFSHFLQYLPIAWVYDSSGALKAAGLVVPYPPAESPFEAPLQQSVGQGNFAAFQTFLSTVSGVGWGPVGYDIRGLTANTTYTMVVTSPNYPPNKSTVYTGPAGSTTSFNVNMDLNQGVTLSGVVETTATVPVPISNANVTLQAKSFNSTTITTNSSGTWSILGLPSGDYTLTATAAGYVSSAQELTIGGSGSATAQPFMLTVSNASITGRVYTTNPICGLNDPSCLPFVQTALGGAKILAYDDSINASSPTAVLPLFETLANSSGIYTLNGLQAGDTYKIFADAHGPSGRGYFVVSQSTLAIAGTRSGVDFSLQPKALTVNAFGHQAATTYEFLITNYTEFSNGTGWVGDSPFVKATSTQIAPGMISQAPRGLVIDYPLSNLSSGKLYTLHIEAQPNDPTAPLVVREVTFGINAPHNVCQDVDEVLLGASGSDEKGLPLDEAPLDVTGSGANGSSIGMPAGAVLPTLSTAVPSMCMSESAVSTGPVITGLGAINVTNTSAFASNVYQVKLSSVNYTTKGINLTFAYNQTGADLTDLGLYSYSTSTLKWTLVSGVQTIDPVRGTISIHGLGSVSTARLQSNSPLLAQNIGTGFRPNSVPSGLRPDDVGLFAVLRPSIASTGTLTNSTVAGFKIFNFPNPFNLSTKSVATNTTATNPCVGQSATVTTGGTVIKIEVPAGIGGNALLRVYTLNGELVREMDQGPLTGGTCYYTTWDGKNRAGTNVANGVYYGMLSIPGVSSRDATFKMAVIK